MQAEVTSNAFVEKKNVASAFAGREYYPGKVISAGAFSDGFVLNRMKFALSGFSRKIILICGPRGCVLSKIAMPDDCGSEYLCNETKRKKMSKL